MFSQPIVHKSSSIFFTSFQASQDTSSLEKLENLFSAIFHIFSYVEQSDNKSFKAGPYCFGPIIFEIIFFILQILGNPSLCEK